jgi:hypothetical protein
MFRTLAQLYATTGSLPGTPQPETVFATHPLQLSRWLEQVFINGGLTNVPVPAPTVQPVPLGDGAVATRLSGPRALLDSLTSGLTPTGPPPAIPGFAPAPTVALGTASALPWDHLIYAYLIESTGIVEILGEVVRRLAIGETLQSPAVETLVWARATEELFFRDPPLFHILGTTSSLRPHAAENRRNAYYRMFGCTPPQAPPDDRWKRDVGAGANLRFLELWNDLLRQVWMGVVNARNAVGVNATDPSYVAYLCQTIGELLRMRRRGGMLAREEFAYVSMLSWFHLTVENDNPIVVDLRSKAGPLGNPADRLTAIAGQVGMRMAPQSRELFELADLMSTFLWAVELQAFDSSAQAEMLYAQPATPNPVAETLVRIIDLWQSATGERLKDVAVTVTGSTNGRGLPASAQPLRLPAGAPTAGGSTPARNGHTVHPGR